MKHCKSIIALVMLLTGVVLAPLDSLADEMGGMAGMSEHHHHAMHMPMPGDGYARSVATYHIPDVKLTDENGKKVALQDTLDGADPVMLNFIFTTCSTVCPVLSATFSKMQAKLGAKGEKVRLVSISIDPEQDTPAKLKEYAKRFEAGPQWSMLTGSIENSIAVQRAFNIYRGDKMNHEPVTFMRTGAGQSWVRFDGFISADDLLSEYRKLASN